MLRISLAQPKHQEEIIDLIHDSIRNTSSVNYNKHQKEAWVKRVDALRLQELMEQLDYYYAHETNNPKILGIIGIQSQNGFIHSLFVSPKAQRKGVASRLLEFSSNIFTKSNFQKIEVDASHMALPFFKKKGFKIVRNNLVDINGILLENFSMEKFLA